MAGKGLYRALLWSASLLGVICFIFANSLTPRAESAAESRSFLDFFLSFLPSVTHHAVRKLAHLAEYALLGAHLAFLPLLFPLPLRKSIPLGLLFGLLIASLDEGIQYFVPGRGASARDVLLDFVGCLLALFSVLFLFFLISKVRRRKRNA